MEYSFTVNKLNSFEELVHDYFDSFLVEILCLHQALVQILIHEFENQS